MAFVDWATAFGATTATSDVTVAAGDEIEISTNVTCRDLNIDEGGTLRYKTDTSAELTCHGNVVIYGGLEMQPASFAAHHTFSFVNIDPEDFVGGGNVVLTTDRGMWVREAGYLAIDGPYRKAWTRAAGSLTTGQTALTMEAEPTGWQVGDRISVAPTRSPGSWSPTPVANTFDVEFDERTIASVVGNVVTVTAGLTYPHPQVDIGDGVVMRAEVMNLTRNAKIQGEQYGEAHIHCHVHDNTHGNFSVSQLQLHDMGPRRAPTDVDLQGGILGRYPFHFHHGFEATRGIFMDSLVVSRGRNRGFITHQANGVAWRGCVAYDVRDTPFWWDGNDTSNDTIYDRCVAAKVEAPWPAHGYRMAGFDLRGSTGAKVIGCVAVGILGNVTASGYHWPEITNPDRLWIFEDNVAHNCRRNGIFTWQNDHEAHIVDRFVAYHNGAYGIDHGAYGNGFLYKNNSLYGNSYGSLGLHSHTGPILSQRFFRCHLRGGGIALYGIDLRQHVLEALHGPTTFDGCIIEGHVDYQIGGGTDGAPESLELVNSTLSSPVGATDFYLLSTTRTGSLLSVDNGGQAFEVRPAIDTGTLNTAWNARVTNVASFAPSAQPAFEPLDLTRQMLAAAPEAPPDVGDGPLEPEAEPLLVVDDDFTGTDGAALDTGNWVVTLTGTSSAAIASNKAKLNCPTNGYAAITANYPPFVDQEVYLTHINGATSNRLLVSLRHDFAGTDTGYRLFIQENGGTGVQIWKDTPGSAVIVVAQSNVRTGAAQQRIRYRVFGALVQLKIWDVGDEEPLLWEIEYTDPDPIVSGNVTIAAEHGAGGSFIEIDDVEIWDLDPPLVPEITVTTVPPIADSNTGWRTANVQVSAVADQDNVDIEYQADSAGIWLAYTVPFTITAEGPHHYQFRGTNVAGTSDPLTFSFQIDKTAPTATASLAAGAVTLAGIDPQAEGVDLVSDIGAVYYSLNGADFETYTASVPVVNGDVVEYYAVDVAGNIGDTETFTAGGLSLRPFSVTVS